MASVLEIVNGISQVLANSYDGATDEDGEPVKIGLKREEGHPINDSRVMDGFSVKMYPGKICIHYHAEIKLKDLHKNDFESDIEEMIEQIAKFLKKEFKKKEKDGTEIVGNLIKAKTAKSRLSKENKDVTVRLYYDERGLDRYYGLLELGELGGLWKNVAGRYEIDGKKVYAKAIYKDPESYFTPEVMEKLDAIAKEQFSYGS